VSKENSRHRNCITRILFVTVRERAGRLIRRSRFLRVLGPAFVVVVVVLGAVWFVAGELRESRATTPRPVLLASGAWAPFVGSDQAEGGPLAVLVTEVLRRAGFTPQVSYSSWPLAESRARTGEAIGAFPLVDSAARRADLLISDPLVEFEYVLFYDRSRPTPVVTSPADLAGLRIGRVAGYDYWPELEDAVPEFVEYPTSLRAFRALADGEIDLLPEGLLSGQAVLGSPQFAADAGAFSYLDGESPLVRSTEELYFMMRRSSESAAVMREFDAALASIRTTDAYAQIVEDLTAQGSSAEVELVPADEGGLVDLLSQDGALSLLATRGTRARVLTWPEEFVSAVAPPVGAPRPVSSGREAAPAWLVEVKLLNGPAQGRVFWVDARAVVLLEADR
jgi:hypothetical protein